MDTKKRSKRIAVFDVETEGLNATKKAFKCGVVMTETEVFRFTDHTKMKKFLHSMDGYLIYAHNLEYDSNTMFGNVWKIDPSPIYTNSLLLSFKQDGNEYINSIQIFQAPLAKIAENLGMKKPEDGFTFTGKKLLDYCQHDCLILLTGLQMILSKDGFLKKTIASQAMAKYKMFFEPEPMTSRFNNLIRPTYYGGRCEAFKIAKVPDSWYYDINSLYPFIAGEILYPDMRFATIIKNPPLKTIEREMSTKGGFFFGTIYVPKDVPPPLPCRNIKAKKIFYPVGFITGQWTFIEIENALQYGCSIYKCSQIIVAPLARRKSLKRYCEHYYKERLESKGFMQYYNKLMLNGLLGKFAQRGITKRTYFGDYTLVSPKVIFDSANEIKFFKKGSDSGYIERLMSREIYDASISIYLTSAARVYMYGFLHEYYDSVTYMDTDSLVSSKKLNLPISNKGLGLFKIEHESIYMEIFGAKNYMIGEKRVIKGIPKKAEQIEPNTYKYLKMNSGKQALRNGRESGIFETVIKTIKNKYDKRLVDLNTGNTTPLYYDSED